MARSRASSCQRLIDQVSNARVPVFRNRKEAMKCKRWIHGVKKGSIGNIKEKTMNNKDCSPYANVLQSLGAESKIEVNSNRLTNDIAEKNLLSQRNIQQEDNCQAKRGSEYKPEAILKETITMTKASTTNSI